MKTIRPVVAKIVNHSEGLGAPSPDTVRERANELARIDGRTAITDEDWKQAHRELHGGGFSQDDEVEMAAVVSGRDMIHADLGHRKENIRYEDAEIATELVAEGMDEAVHDQMLQAAVDAEKEEE